MYTFLFDDLVNFIKYLFSNDKELEKKILRILKITVLLTKIKKNIRSESVGMEAYGMHGIYYSKKINYNLYNIIKDDIF